MIYNTNFYTSENTIYHALFWIKKCEPMFESTYNKHPILIYRTSFPHQVSPSSYTQIHIINITLSFSTTILQNIHPSLQASPSLSFPVTNTPKQYLTQRSIHSLNQIPRQQFLRIGL